MTKLLALLSTTIILFSCSTGSVLTSKRITTNDPSIVTKSTGAYYSLPRIRIRVDIQEIILNNNGNKTKTGKYRTNIVDDKSTFDKWGSELNSVVVEPDPRHYYLLNYHPDSASSDTITISLTGSASAPSIKGEKPGSDSSIRGQFLEKINVKTIDESASVVDAFVDVAKMALHKIPPGKESGRDDSDKKDNITYKKVATLLIDPADACRTGNNEKDLSSQRLEGYKLSCRLFRGGQKVEDKSLQYSGTDTPNSATCTGICFRPELHYELVFYDSLSTEIKNILGIYSLTMPNAAPVISLDVTRAAFVEKDTVLEFKHGLLKKVTITKPSETKAFAKIPIDIGKEILSIPAELIQLKININTQKGTEASGETALLKNQILLIEEKLKLSEAQKKNESVSNVDNGDSTNPSGSNSEAELTSPSPPAPSSSESN